MVEQRPVSPEFANHVVNLWRVYRAAVDISSVARVVRTFTDAILPGYPYGEQPHYRFSEDEALTLADGVLTAWRDVQGNAADLTVITAGVLYQTCKRRDTAATIRQRIGEPP